MGNARKRSQTWEGARKENVATSTNREGHEFTRAINRREEKRGFSR